MSRECPEPRKERGSRGRSRSGFSSVTRGRGRTFRGRGALSVSGNDYESVPPMVIPEDSGPNPFPSLENLDEYRKEADERAVKDKE